MDYIVWIKDGLAKSGKTRSGLAKALGRAPSAITDLLAGKRELKASEILAVATYLELAPPPLFGVTRIVGRAGATPDGEVHFASGQGDFGEAPMPPGATKDTVAVEIFGDSMRGVAPNGWLVYYDELRHPPTPDMMGELCVVGLKDERVLIKYLHRGRGPDLFDLESVSAPTMRDVPVLWAALVTALIPGPTARRIIRREAAKAAAVKPTGRKQPAAKKRARK
jgi:hypothetical protein